MCWAPREILGIPNWTQLEIVAYPANQHFILPLLRYDFLLQLLLYNVIAIDRCRLWRSAAAALVARLVLVVVVISPGIQVSHSSLHSHQLVVVSSSLRQLHCYHQHQFSFRYFCCCFVVVVEVDGMKCLTNYQ